MKVEGEFTVSDCYSGIGIKTPMGLFGVAQRDGGIEVMLEGKTVWTSHELPGGSEERIRGAIHEDIIAQGVVSHREASFRSGMRPADMVPLPFEIGQGALELWFQNELQTADPRWWLVTTTRAETAIDLLALNNWLLDRRLELRRPVGDLVDVQRACPHERTEESGYMQLRCKSCDASLVVPI